MVALLERVITHIRKMLRGFMLDTIDYEMMQVYTGNMLNISSREYIVGPDCVAS